MPVNVANVPVNCRQSATLPIAVPDSSERDQPEPSPARHRAAAERAARVKGPVLLSELTADIVDAKHMLDLARAEGDALKIDLREAALNDLLQRYSYHSCHESQPERTTDARNTRRNRRAD